METGSHTSSPTSHRHHPGLPENERSLVIIVDDDAAVREGLQELMLTVGVDCVCFASTGELLGAGLPDRPGCLVLDVRMPGSSGLELQRHLTAQGNPKPIVFLTAHGDIPMTVKAMKAGAVDFLTKPFRDQTLLDAVALGIERDVAQRAETRVVSRHIERAQRLTPREQQVMRAMAYGQLNKQIAFDLGISEVTVKLHRSNVMRKMEVASIGELVRAWEALPAPMRSRFPG